MEVTLSELAALVGGRVEGDPQLKISGAATLRDAQPGQISFAVPEKFIARLHETRASAIVSKKTIPDLAASFLLCDSPQAAFATIVKQLQPRAWQQVQGISPSAHVHPLAILGRGVAIAPGAVICEGARLDDRVVVHSGSVIMAGCRVGADTEIFPNCVLYESTIVGQRCRLHAGVVLGADGFGYELKQGALALSAQLGWVEIENDVEIGANTTIDRGTYGPTLICMGTKIDDQVMIGHNCRIGRHNLLCSQVGIAGSSSTGDYVVMAGQVGIRDHVHIGDRAQLGAQTGVATDLEGGISYYGSPAHTVREQGRIYISMQKAPELRREVRELRTTVRLLGERLEVAERAVAALAIARRPSDDRPAEAA